MKGIAISVIALSLFLLTSCTDISDNGGYETDFEETLASTSEAMVANEVTEAAVTESAVGPEETDYSPVTNYGESARHYLEGLAVDIGDREPGSDGEVQAAQYIQTVFEEIGYEPELSEFIIEDDEEGITFTSSNVVAVKEGLSDQVIVVGAHYDAAYEDGTTGADDNASGVAVLLEAASLVFDEETPYTIHFVTFGSEELDLNGSTDYVNNLSNAEEKNIIGMFNLDSLIAGDKLYVYGDEGSDSMRDWVLEDAEELDFAIEGKTSEELNNEDGTPCECADYDAFEKAEIPFAYFEATNWDLSPDAMTQVDPGFGVDGAIRHTQYDTIEYIDETFPGRINEHLNVFVTLLFDLLTQYN